MRDDFSSSSPLRKRGALPGKGGVRAEQAKRLRRIRGREVSVRPALRIARNSLLSAAPSFGKAACRFQLKAATFSDLVPATVPI
jgi:hypothetical protein